MSTLYLTQIVLSPKTKTKKTKSQSKNKISTFQTPHKTTPKIQSQSLQPINKSHYENTKFNSSFKQIFLNDYLHFLMDTQLKYADINSIKKHYQSQIIKYHNKFNMNLHIIKKKQEEKMKLQHHIEEILLNKYTINQELFENYYDKMLSNIKHAIKTYQHSLKVYSHVKNRLHHQHFMIKKRIDTEIYTEEKNTQQLHQFQILQILAKRSSKDQFVIVNRLKAINLDSQEKYKEIEIEKTKQINSLQSDIEIIKKDSDEYEKTLNYIKAKNFNLSQLVNTYIEENKLVREEYFSIMKDYYESKIKINLLMSDLQVKTIDDLICKFNIQNSTYKHFKNGYSFTNHELINLSNSYSELESTLQSLKQQIKIQKKRNQIPQKSYYDCKLETNKQALFSFNNKELIHNIEQKRCLCEQVLFYMSNLISQSMKMVPQLRDNLMLNSYDTIKIKNLTITNETDIHNIKDGIILFRQFSLCFFYLLFTSISKEIVYNSIFELNKHGFIIIPLFTKKNINMLYKEIERVKEQNDNRFSFLRKNEMDILKNLNINSSGINNEISSEEGIINLKRKKKMKQRGKVSQTNMLGRFISYMKVQKHNSISLKKARNEYVSHEEESNADNFQSKYIEGHERQIKNLFSRFQNDLIYKDKNPDDYKTFYCTKPNNADKVELTKFPKSNRDEITQNRTTIKKGVFNLEQDKIMSSSKINQNNDVEWEQDSAEIQYKSKPKLKIQHSFLNTTFKIRGFEDTTKSIYRKKLLSPETKGNYTYYKDDIDKQNIFLRRGEIRKLEMTYVKGFNGKSKEQIEIKDEKGNKINLNEVFYEYSKKYGTNVSKGRENNKSKTSTMNLNKMNNTLSPREFRKYKMNQKTIKSKIWKEKEKSEEKENKKIKAILENQIINGNLFKQKTISFDKENDEVFKREKIQIFPHIKNKS